MARSERDGEVGMNAASAAPRRLARRLRDRLRRLRPGRRRAAIAGGALLALLLVVLAASYLVDEPLRRYIEREMNARLDGYTVTIGQVDFHPVGLSIDFRDLLVVQNAHRDPPVARIPELSASVQWRALLRAALVADFGVRGPVIHVNRAHFAREVEDPKAVTDKGWQDALQAMYPLEINLFRVWDGEVTYVDDAPDARPLRLAQVHVRAGNIRNIESPDRVYPSHLRLEAVVFGSGRLVVDGNADFLARPHLGVLARIRIENVQLDYFKPILARQHFALRRGTVSALGNVEYAPTTKAVHLEDAVVRGVDGEYVHTAAATLREKETVAKVATKAEEVTNAPELELRVDRLRVEKSNVGFVNRAANPSYRVFLSDASLELTNFSNHFANGPGRAMLRGRFMDSGATMATATFRPERDGPDFDLDVRIDDADLAALNELLRAYGKFDVVGGFFSFYAELGVKNRQITGYVKPLFRDLDVYDERQDRDKGVFRKLYERLVGGVSKLLENAPRSEVATKTDLQGPVQNPKADTWQVLLRLVQNAFFKAILPGFDHEVGRLGRE